jgi:hypothetical protein
MAGNGKGSGEYTSKSTKHKSIVVINLPRKNSQ